MPFNEQQLAVVRNHFANTYDIALTKGKQVEKRQFPLCSTSSISSMAWFLQGTVEKESEGIFVKITFDNETEARQLGLLREQAARDGVCLVGFGDSWVCKIPDFPHAVVVSSLCRGDGCDFIDAGRREIASLVSKGIIAVENFSGTAEDHERMLLMGLGLWWAESDVQKEQVDVLMDRWSEEGERARQSIACLQQCITKGMDELAAALEILHSMGFSYGTDFKPENTVIDHKGKYKLIDFEDTRKTGGEVLVPAVFTLQYASSNVLKYRRALQQVMQEDDGAKFPVYSYREVEKKQFLFIRALMMGLGWSTSCWQWREECARTVTQCAGNSASPADSMRIMGGAIKLVIEAQDGHPFPEGLMYPGLFSVREGSQKPPEKAQNSWNMKKDLMRRSFFDDMAELHPLPNECETDDLSDDSAKLLSSKGNSKIKPLRPCFPCWPL